MTMNIDSSSRTIIINGLKPNFIYPASNNSLPICKMDASTNNAETQKKGRKRTLEHLSFEEKILRKKLKNREAAQSSRDRKKARMDELESTVKLLGRCNKELSVRLNKVECEKKELQLENDRLKEVQLENDRLKEEIRCLRSRCTLESKTGSAESHVFPLPKGHSSHPVTSSNPLLIQIVFLQMIIYIGSLTPSTISQNSTNWSKIFSINQRTQRITTNSSTKWWGRHQRCWNPVDQNPPRVIRAL